MSSPLVGRATSILDWSLWGRLVVQPQRVYLKLSRWKLARKAGVSGHAIARLELGRTRRPTLRFLRALCNALDMSLPGDEGLYLSLDGVSAYPLRRVVYAALSEFAHSRRDPERYVRLLRMSATRGQIREFAVGVAADRDVASELMALLRCSEPDPTPPRPHRPHPRRTGSASSR